MLEEDLSNLNFKQKLLKWFFIIGAPIWIWWFLVHENFEIYQFLIGGTLGYGALLLFFLGPIWMKKRALRNYLDSLETKQMDLALTYGRLYYRFKRGKYFSELHETNAADEQAIHNDIITYQSK